MTDQRNLELLLESHFPILVIETHEELRTLELLQTIVKKTNKGMHIWSAADGLKHHLVSKSDFSIEGMSLEGRQSDEKDLTDPEEALREIKKSIINEIIVLMDFHPYLTNPKILRLVKELALNASRSENILVLISHRLEVPEEIKRLTANFKLSLPDENNLRQLILEEAKAWSIKNRAQKVKTDNKAIDLLVRNLLGLTISDSKRLIRNAIYDDGAITHSDIESVMQAKYQLVSQDSALTFEYDTVAFNDVGGFKNLKKWLDIRKNYFLDSSSENQVDTPKGILLLGVQGCGKSLAAKSVAGCWGVPLLRLDFGALYNKYIGETEKNIRDALNAAQQLAPCVMWIDEIEKGIQTDSNDSGTSQRVLGTLLTWMAENNSKVFIVATANNISSLPPELIRKGRLDEIFFVDLPCNQTREEIFKVHLNKRKIKQDKINFEEIIDLSDGFSGSEIEQAIVSACYSALSVEEELNSRHILEEIKQTRPLSIVMEEEISQLRNWAKNRTVIA